MNRKRILSVFTLCMMILPLVAAPALRRPRPVTQPDGTTLTLTSHGDEFFHWLTDEQGRWVERGSDGFYRAVPALTPAQIAARRAAFPMRVTQGVPNIGTRVSIPRVLVILTQFSDVTFRAENNVAAFDSLFNSDHYTYNDATGSVRQYFSDQSLGQYQPQFDIVGPVTASKASTYYGQGDNDSHLGELVSEACRLADTQYDIDFADYDSDGDNYVDAVFVIYASYGAADGGDKNTIWPKKWQVSAQTTAPTIDGKRVDVYVCSNEIYNEAAYGYDTSADRREGIALMCHEFSHALGLPDIYCAANSNYTFKTSGTWDVMDYPYANDGRTPPGYTAYEMFFMGWITPRVLNTALNDTLGELHATGDCRIITATGEHNLNGVSPDPAEYYLLENRQQTGWDAYTMGRGMLLTKVRWSASAWSNNRVNNSASDLRIDIIEADGRATEYGDQDDPYGWFGKAGDCFPTGATACSPYEAYPLTDIAQQPDGTVTFRFMGGAPDAPTGLPSYNEHYSATVYDMLGHPLSADLNALPHGIYIIQTNKNTYKLCK